MDSIGITHHIMNPNKLDPSSGPIIPIGVIAPDRPWSILLKFTIDIGLFLDIFPISVAQVSDIAAEMDVSNTDENTN